MHSNAKRVPFPISFNMLNAFGRQHIHKQRLSYSLLWTRNPIFIDTTPNICLLDRFTTSFSWCSIQLIFIMIQSYKIYVRSATRKSCNILTSINYLITFHSYYHPIRCRTTSYSHRFILNGSLNLIGYIPAFSFSKYSCSDRCICFLPESI